MADATLTFIETGTEALCMMSPLEGDTGENDIQEFNVAFHKAWSACVGTKDYNKKAWMDIQRQLNAVGIYT